MLRRRIARPVTDSDGKTVMFEQPRINHALFEGLTPQECHDLVEMIKNCSMVRQRVTNVLTKARENAIIQSEDKKNLESPNYVGVLADLAGFRRGLRFAIDLLTLQGDPQP